MHAKCMFTCISCYLNFNKYLANMLKLLFDIIVTFNSKCVSKCVLNYYTFAINVSIIVK